MFRRAVVLLVAAMATAGCGGSRRSTVAVGAAVSLTEALEDAGREYEARTGTRVTFNFGASNFVATQVINGAPMDLFISADDGQMDRAAAGGGIETSSRTPLLSNSLVIVMRSERATQWSDPSRLVAAAIKRVAIGDPAAVPAGIYAKQYLERRGLWTALDGRVLPSLSVRAALAAVATGGADAGIVYATDVATERGVSVVYRVSPAEGPPIIYPAAVTRRSRNPEGARAFLDFLQSQRSRDIFTRHGFTPVDRAHHD
jgi:molybdate transport system substrate-binding protein